MCFLFGYVFWWLFFIERLIFFLSWFFNFWGFRGFCSFKINLFILCLLTECNLHLATLLSFHLLFLLWTLSSLRCSHFSNWFNFKFTFLFLFWGLICFIKSFTSAFLNYWIYWFQFILGRELHALLGIISNNQWCI